MDTPAPEISVVVPVYNEEHSLRELHDRLTAVMGGLGRPYELVFVNDGSRDGSLALLRELRRGDPRVRVASLMRNFGQSPALYAGFSLARGRFLVMLDADLQVYPEDIPLVLEQLEAGADCVSGRRTGRQDPFFRRLFSQALNLYIAYETGVPLTDYGCPLKGFRREVVEHMLRFDHRCRYLPVDMTAVTTNIAEIPVRHAERKSGRSKYELADLVRTAVDLITNISVRPLRMIGLLGILLALGGFFMFVRVLYFRVVYGNQLGAESVIALFFLLCGVQLLSLGTLCEYVGRIYAETQKKPYFIIRGEEE